MNKQSMADIAVVGLGVMGRNLALNFADRGFTVATYDPFPSVVEQAKAALEPQIAVYADPATLVGSLKKPAKILIMVKAGKPVEDVIDHFIPLLDKGDILIDGGNTQYRDTERRRDKLAAHGLHFVGLGVSGGEEGARHGPALMAGGTPEALDAVTPILAPIAARAGDGEPCYANHGPGGAGHFVKMVHNGIEYAMMQMLAEAYLLMSGPGALSADAIADAFASWNKGPAASYLVEISAKVMATKDSETGKPLVEIIRDVAGHKGTGRWTVEAGLDYGIASPSIAAAFLARALSGRERLTGTKRSVAVDPALLSTLADKLGAALPAAMLAAYCQGLELIAAASSENGWGTDLAAVAKGWRAGCIIRSAMLDPLAAAQSEDDLLASPFALETLAASEQPLREALMVGVAAGIPTPALLSALCWLDGRRSACLGANLIQGQRDYFGAHTFERIDRSGSFHHPWTF